MMQTTVKPSYYLRYILFTLLIFFSCEKGDEILPKSTDNTQGQEEPRKGNEQGTLDSLALLDSLNSVDSLAKIDSLAFLDSLTVVDSLARIDSLAYADSLARADSLQNLAPEKDPDPATYVARKLNDLPYRVLIPKNYSASKEYPLLIFLHGISERGTDNKRQLTWGASLFQADSIREKYPAFIVFPQCPADHHWFDKWATENLRALIDNLVARQSIDKNRIYIGGLSMGAYGTYSMVAKNPDLFAAAIAIAGDGDENKAPVMSHTKWRIYAGDKDNIVTSDKSEKMAHALERSGASVSLTIYHGADHLGSWVRAFEEPDFCQWLFSNVKE